MSDQQWCTQCHTYGHRYTDCPEPPPHANAKVYTSEVVHSALMPPGQTLIGDLRHAAMLYEPVPRWRDKPHWWHLGRFSGGWSPVHSGLGRVIGYALYVLRSRRLSIEIRWVDRG